MTTATATATTTTTTTGRPPSLLRSLGYAVMTVAVSTWLLGALWARSEEADPPGVSASAAAR